MKITNDGKEIKKLGYYTNKLMVEKLEGFDWNSTQEVHSNDNVYVYKFVKSGKPIYVAWWDYFDDSNYVKGNTKTMKLSDI